MTLTASCACALAAPAAAGPAPEYGAITGRVIDVTCFGPCVVGSHPRPFEGEADVVVSERRSGEPVARVAVEKSRYQLKVPAGRYRVVAVPYPMQDSTCWQGEPRRVTVDPGEVKRRRLQVENVCVL